MSAAPSFVGLSWADTVISVTLAALATPPLEDEFNGRVQLKRSQEKGAYLVATHTVPRGEVIFRDRPILFVARDLKARCLNCAAAHSDKSTTHRTCSECGHRWCSTACLEQNSVFHCTECVLLQCLPSAELKCAKYKTVQKHDVAMMLRGLAVKVADPDRWARLCRLEDHRHIAENQDQRFIGWSLAAHDICGILRANRRVNYDVLPDDVLKPLLLSHVNSVSGATGALGDPGHSNAPIAIYPSFARLEHSCMPNLVFHNMPNGPMEVVLRARRQIEAGECLSISYVLLDEPTHRRQAILQRDKYFRCQCPRCTCKGSGTEPPGKLCGLRCGSNCPGVVLPTEPDYDVSGRDWRCNRCKRSVPFKTVDLLEERMREVFDAAQTPEDCRKLLKEFGSKLAEGHYMRFLCQAHIADLSLRPVEKLYFTGRAKEIPERDIQKIITLYEQDILPWARQWLPRGVLQMHCSWCTIFYRLGQVRLVRSMHSGCLELLQEALSAYEEALSETHLCMGKDFAAPLEGFVVQLRKSAASAPRVVDSHKS